MIENSKKSKISKISKKIKQSKKSLFGKQSLVENRNNIKSKNTNTNTMNNKTLNKLPNDIPTIKKFTFKIIMLNNIRYASVFNG